MKNYSKLLFLTILFSSSMLTISSTNWLGMWMGMEMNLMAFIPLISKSKNKGASYAMIIYFLTQSLGSVILLFSIMMNLFIMISPTMVKSSIMMMVMISIMIKLGAAPFHNWVPEMMSKLNWTENTLLMTWQKINPLLFLSVMNMNQYIMFLSIAFSSIIGAIGGVNITSLRKIMAYSSINHMSWMMMMMVSQAQWFMYWMIYSMMIILMTTMFYMNNHLYLNQITNPSMTATEKLNYMIMFMSMGGLPPFLGFLPKWMVIQSMMMNGMILLMTIMIMSSLITLFYYMRIMAPTMMMNVTNNKWKKSNSKKYIVMMVLNLMLPLSIVLNFL